MSTIGTRVASRMIVRRCPLGHATSEGGDHDELRRRHASSERRRRILLYGKAILVAETDGQASDGTAGLGSAQHRAPATEQAVRPQSVNDLLIQERLPSSLRGRGGPC